MSRSGGIVARPLRRTVAVAVLALGLMLGVVPRAAHAACVGDCNNSNSVTVDELLTLVNIALGDADFSTCVAGDADNSQMITIDEILTAVNNALNGCPVLPTATPTATSPPTATVTVTPTATIVRTFGPLGIRHFVVNMSMSPFQATLGANFTLTVAHFQGQVNGQPAPAFLDLEAEQPDPATGVATINVVGASDYIYADARPLAPVICVKPMLPVMSAGVVACNGNFALGFSTIQDHNIGQVGVNGFTAADCEAMNGSLEAPNKICAAGTVGDLCNTNSECDTTGGAGDGVCGLRSSMCRAGKSGACRNNSDCDTEAGAGDGMCGSNEPHPGACNGPLVASAYPGDSGPGAVILAPDDQFHLVGLPVRLSVQSSLPCTDPGPNADITFALTSGISKSTVLNAGNMTGETLTFQTQGRNFSCDDWTNADGLAPGKLVLGAPALDQNPGGGDVVTGFTFDDSPVPPTLTPTITRTPTENPPATETPTPM